MVDSLVKAGLQRHDIAGPSWWPDLMSLDRQAPAGVPFYVFTDGLLAHFSGQRPVTGRPVYWYVHTPGDSTVHWEESSWRLGPDSIGVITGSSTPTGTSFSYRTVGGPEAGGSKEPIDTSTLRVVIYTDEKYNSDGQWLTGAIKALRQFTHRNIELISTRAGGSQPNSGPLPAMGRLPPGGMTPPDWVFWLSSQPLPPDQHTANLVLYEPGQEVPVDTWIRGGEFLADTWMPGSDVTVEKVSAQTRELQPATPLRTAWVSRDVWVDGFGRPLLTLEETAVGRRYHLFSHFDPAWNELVWSRDFPVRLEELLLGRNGRGWDKRVIDPQQVTPSRGTEGTEARGGQASSQIQADGLVSQTALDLTPAGWLLVFLTLAVERILSYFRKTKDG
jgi:hypothetical protein